MTDTKKAILLAVLGFFLFTVGDAARKVVLARGYSVLEVQFWAALCATVVILFFSRNLGGIGSLKRLNRPWMHALKSCFVAGIMLSAIMALKYLDLALFYTIVLTAPFLTAAFARIFFNERLNKVKVALIALGFGGVMIALHPGAQAFNPGILFALLLTVLFSGNNLLSKLFPSSEAKLPFGFYPYLLTTLLCFFMTGLQPGIPAMTDMPLLILAGACSTLAIVSHVKAFQLAPAHIVAPYHYTQIVWGALFSYAIFSQIPGLWTIAGSAVIILSGLALYRMDRKKEAPLV